MRDVCEPAAVSFSVPSSLVKCFLNLPPTTEVTRRAQGDAHQGARVEGS